MYTKLYFNYEKAVDIIINSEYENILTTVVKIKETLHCQGNRIIAS